MQSEEQLVFKMLNFMFRALTATKKKAAERFPPPGKGVVINALFVIA